MPLYLLTKSYKLVLFSGLLCAIFQDLYDNNIFSYESFIAWETSKDPAEQVGKGVALKSLTSFYTSLKESESSCDES